MKSFWNEEENYISLESIKEDVDTDVCIIGGGLAGLSTAYYLSKKGMLVTVLEKDKILSHTSGKNTGKITSQHGLFYKYLIDSKGEDYAKLYFEANEEAKNNIKKIIDEEKIECDFETTNAYVYTENQDELQKIKDEVIACKQIGIDCDFKTNIDLPINIQGAIEFKNQSMFHPKKYGIGICKAILTNKGQIYEESKAINIQKQSDLFEIDTENGYKVKSKYLVLASHYPILNAPGYYFFKMYQSTSYAILIDPKDNKIFSGMYINTIDPVYSFRTVKVLDKDYILIVGLDHKTGAKIDLSNAFNNLEKMAKRIYPNSEVKYKWSAQDAITLDKIPYIGDFSKFMKNSFIATGFNKWGITGTNIAANIIKDKIFEKENKYEEIFKATRVEMIKNIKEVENMLKETTNSLVINKFKVPEDSFKDIKNGEGKIVIIDDKKIGVYKDENGKVYKVNPICSHLGCELSWNNLEKTWDCPCHGSRFKFTGESIEAPSIENIKIIE